MAAENWSRKTWFSAGPVMLSNISVPPLGAVDTAVVGHLPGPHYLGYREIARMLQLSAKCLDIERFATREGKSLPEDVHSRRQSLHQGFQRDEQQAVTHRGNPGQCAQSLRSNILVRREEVIRQTLPVGKPSQWRGVTAAAVELKFAVK